MPNLTDIPGISQIWTRRKDDPRVKIAILLLGKLNIPGAIAFL